MSGSWALVRKTVANTSLVLASLLLGTAACEGYLRFFHPVYEYAAEAPYDFDHRRIFARKAHSMHTRPHPDTGLHHSVIHNNLALRQHRDFHADDLAGAINVGVFGDSFTENLRLPVQYSFVEILDYLLSRASHQDDTRQRFNVLNLGVDGYGTDQAFLYYEDFEHSSKLDVVFYLFCVNDLKEIRENELFLMNEFGALTLNPRSATAPSPWLSLLSGFHTTYLVIDGAKRLAGLIEANLPDLVTEARTSIYAEWKKRQNSIEAQAVIVDVRDGTADSEQARAATRVFQSILRTWHRAVEDRDGRFVVAVLPRPRDRQAAERIPPEIETTDLFRCFNEHVAGFNYRPPWRFVNDGHLAEQGNMLAAMCLYRFLEQELDLPARSDDELLAQMYRYYLAFQDDTHTRIPPPPPPLGTAIGRTPIHAVGPAGLNLRLDRLQRVVAARRTWMPPEEWARPLAVRSGELTAIRTKYLASEISPTTAAPAANAGFDGWTVHRNVFDLYLNGATLLYVRTPCAPADLRAMFFLHIYPVDVNDLSDGRRVYGYDNWDSSLFRRLDNFPDDVCIAGILLPSYDIASIRTGQYSPGDGRIWQETIVLDGLSPD